MEDWSQVLVDNPRVLWGIVADIVKAAKAAEGERKTGRRPAVSVGSLDELYDVLFPVQYSEKPFGEAFADLLAGRSLSQNAFAAASGISQPTVWRLAAGKATPTVEMIERIAYHLDVRPTYFPEYRALKLAQSLTDTLIAFPVLSADAVRRLTGVAL